MKLQHAAPAPGTAPVPAPPSKLGGNGSFIVPPGVVASRMKASDSGGSPAVMVDQAGKEFNVVAAPPPSPELADEGTMEDGFLDVEKRASYSGLS
ncbi:hypothetical protein QFC24_000578 [Naganishia onofrii]|uniref:Uncharacterized protein n=1 Tax=Naganishia onofrii TaxID=1851511 RepID=A0ACC2XX69_9TREE|nr:hypothetical protein QFC24_000578 [Naganishia onofrii]